MLLVIWRNCMLVTLFPTEGTLLCQAIGRQDKYFVFLCHGWRITRISTSAAFIIFLFGSTDLWNFQIVFPRGALCKRLSRFENYLWVLNLRRIRMLVVFLVDKLYSTELPCFFRSTIVSQYSFFIHGCCLEPLHVLGTSLHGILYL